MQVSAQFLPLYSLQYHFSEKFSTLPMAYEGEGGWGKKGYICGQALVLLLRFFHQITTLCLLDEKLAGLKGILHSSRADPNHRRFLCRSSQYPWQKRLHFPSLAHSQHSSSALLYRSSTLLSLCSPIIAGFQWANFPSVHPLKARGSLPEWLHYHFAVHLFGGRQAGRQA